MRSILITTLVTATLLATPAQASKIMRGDSNCKLVENVTVGVQFTLPAKSIRDAKAQFDKKTAEVADIAGELKLANLQPQSMNYNIYAQGGNNTPAYNMNGNQQYKMPSSDIAFKFATMLEEKGFKANISSNSYRQGNCN